MEIPPQMFLAISLVTPYLESQEALFLKQENKQTTTKINVEIQQFLFFF